MFSWVVIKDYLYEYWEPYGRGSMEGVLLKGSIEGFYWRVLLKGSIEGFYWRVVIKGLCLWLLRTLSNVLFERIYVYDYIIECSLWRVVIKGLYLWLLRTLSNVLLRGCHKGIIFMIIENLIVCSIEGFYWRVLLRGFYWRVVPYVLTFLFWVYVLQNIFYNTYSEMSIIMRFECMVFRVL
jgi:hypothetical protein